jgi:CCR4-NOT complex subunit CAF16
VAFAGNSIPLSGDFSARKMIEGIQGAEQSRREELMEVLDINPNWRMHRVSDGQRRRVQLCVGLLRPYKVPDPPTCCCARWLGGAYRGRNVSMLDEY